jgi:hypothetical protein
LSFTARIEGAHSDRAASASKKDGLAAPLPPFRDRALHEHRRSSSLPSHLLPSVRVPQERRGLESTPAQDGECETEIDRGEASRGRPYGGVRCNNILTILGSVRHSWVSRDEGTSSSSVVDDRSVHAAGHVPDRRGSHTGNSVREQDQRPSRMLKSPPASETVAREARYMRERRAVDRVGSPSYGPSRTSRLSRAAILWECSPIVPLD